jgi:Ca2+:H+ antiporter
VASIWFSGPITLGLRGVETVLLALTVGVSILTVTPGRATLLQGGVHLAVFAGFLVLAANP